MAPSVRRGTPQKPIPAPGKPPRSVAPVLPFRRPSWRPKHTPIRYVRRVLVALLTCSGCAWLPSEPSWVRKCSSWADTSYAGGYEIIVAAEWCEPVHVEKRWVGVR